MAELTGDYVGKPFCECNCMQLLYDMYSDMGIDVPESFDGLNLSNYLIQWEIDKKSTIKKMIELFNTLSIFSLFSSSEKSFCTFIKILCILFAM